MRIMHLALLLFCVSPVHAFRWHDLWVSHDRQAQIMMDAGNFTAAHETFTRDDWRAAAAFRAKDYTHAASLYQSLDNADAYYNQGNALAHMHQYKPAIKAYDKTLALDPTNQDARHNRDVVNELLKKQEQNQDKQNQDKQNQDKQNQDKQNQDKQNQDKQNQDKQNQDNQNQDKQNQDKQNQDKQNQDKQNQDKQNQDKQNQDKQDQDKQDQDKQDQDKQDQDKQNQTANTPKTSSADREQQQAHEQWLRLIPDDPAGLLREKFLRDYLRRQEAS